MEFVTSVTESSNLVIEMSLFSNLSVGVSEYTRVVFSDVKAHVVSKLDR